ncbi:AraC family transcriptional regulator [Eubacterium ruminantium]|nr:AraC family transcriptional regulator [Eubacterium ruminantium]
MIKIRGIMKNKSREIIQYPSVQGIALTEEESPVEFPDHWHNAAEFTLALKSGGKYMINGKSYTLSKGDLLLVWPRELHSVIHVPKGSSLIIQFSSDPLEHNLDLLSASKYMNDIHHISMKNEPALAKNIHDIISEMRKYYSEKKYFTETKCKLCINKILLLIGEHAINEWQIQMSGAPASTVVWSHIQTACDYIAEHSTDNLTQNEVAAHIGLSPYYFSKIFKECMRISFPEYLSKLRVRTAIGLLSYENLSITECAFQSGFQSTTAFNKAFREITGCSPRDYRKLHRLTPAPAGSQLY